MSINISRNFSGAVVGSVGLVQFQILPCSSLYLFSKSIGPLQCLVSVNHRVLICCPCHFQSSSLFFVYFGFLCLQVSLVSNFCPDTRGRRQSLIQAHLFSCVVGREEHCQQLSLACVGSTYSVWTTLGFPQLKVACASWVYTAQAPGCSAGAPFKAGSVFRALPRSKPLRFSSCVLCPSQVQAAQSTRCLASALSQVGSASYSPPWSQPLSFRGAPQEHHLRCDVCLLWGTDFRL